MNKIFKVIWSHATQTFVVVSELTRSKSKAKASVSDVKMNDVSSLITSGFKLTLISSLLISSIPTAYAAVAIGSTEDNQIKKGTATANNGATHYAYNYDNPGNKNYAGQESARNKDIRYSGDLPSSSGIAIGDHSTTIGSDRFSSGVAIGDYAKATGGLSFALGAYTQATGIGATVIGTAGLASGFNSLAMMRQSAAKANYAMAIGTASWADGVASLAMGSSATAKGKQSIAIGSSDMLAEDGDGNGRASTKYDGVNNTEASGVRSVAIGTTARTSADDTIAFGTRTESTVGGAISMGFEAKSKALDAIAIGTKTRILAEQERGSIAIGKEAGTQGLNNYGVAGTTVDWVGYKQINIEPAEKVDAQQDKVEIGTNSYAYGHDSVAIGTRAQAIFTNNAPSIGTSRNSQNAGTVAIGYQTIAQGDQAVALGSRAEALNRQAMALGNDAFASGVGSIVIGGDDSLPHGSAETAGYQLTIGFNPNGSKFRPSAATGNGAVVVGVHSQALSQGSTAIGVAATAGDNGEVKNKNNVTTATAAKEATAVGARSRAKSEHTTAVGYEAEALGLNSTTVGAESTANSTNSFAGGYNATANGINSTAIGSSAATNGADAIAIGTGAKALNTNTISIGTGNTVTGANSTAIGDPTTISGTGSHSLGNDNTIPDDNSTVIGNSNVLSKGDWSSTSDGSHVVGNNVQIRGENSLAFGNNAMVGDANNEGVEGTVNATAIGTSATAKGANALAVGTGAKASQANNTAIGTSATVTKDAGEDNIAFGSGATVTRGKNSIVMGKDSKSEAENGSSIAIGDNATISSGVKGNAYVIGTNASIASTNGGIAFGNGAKITNSNGGDGSSVAIGEGAIATGTRAISLGYQANTEGNQVDSIAIGSSAATSGTNNIAIGKDAKANGSQGNQIVVGTSANAVGDKSIVLGTNATAQGNQAEQIVIGTGANASGTSQYSIVMGSGAGATREHSTVLGSKANSSVDGGVALGANSVSDRQAGGSATGHRSTYEPYIPATADQAQKDAINATKGTTGAVSVGSSTVKRQITNLAAGAEDTDAVNVAQLKAAVTTAVASSTWNIKENTIQKDVVNSGDNVSFANGTGTTATVEVADSGKTSTVKYSVNKSDLTVAPNGSVTAVTNGDNFATADQVAKAINDSEKTSSVVSTTQAIKVTSKVDGKNTEYDLDLSDATKTSLQNANSALQSWTAQANGNTVKTVSKDNATLNFVNGNNIQVTNDNGQVKIATVEAPTFTTVNAENFTTGTVSITDNGINAGNQKITNLANGTANSDAVTLAQLNASKSVVKAGNNTNVRTETATDGSTVYTVDANATTVSGSDALNITKSDAGNNVTNYALDLSGKTKGEIKQGVDANTTVNTKGITFTGDTGTTERKLGETLAINGDNKLINTAVKDGQVSVSATKALTDAVTNATSALQSIVTTADSKDAQTVNKDSNKANFISGTNIQLTPSKDGITVATKENVDFTTVNATTVNATTVNGDTIKSGDVVITKDGINAGNQTISNVKDGTISENSKEAVNGSQLYTTNQNVTNNTANITKNATDIAKGTVYEGDHAQATTNEFKRALGEKTKVVGGAAKDDLSDNNIGVVSNGVDTLTVKLAKTLENLTNATFGSNSDKTVIDKDGVTITNGTDSTKTVSLTESGLNNGGQKITNVAKGEKDSDAVNVSQLKEYVGDNSYNWTISDGTKNEAVADNGKVSVKGSANDNSATTPGIVTTLTGTDITVDLSTKTKEDIKQGVDANTTVNTKGLTFTADNAGAKTERKLGETLAINGDATLINTKVEDGKVSVTATDKLQTAVTSAESALQSIITTANGVDAQTVNKNSNKANFTNGKNIVLTPSTTGIEVATKDEVDFTTVNATTLNGTTIKSGDVVITKDGINAGDKKITHVADGNVTSDSKEAVNGSQLYATNQNVTNNTNNIAKNTADIAKGTVYAGDVGNSFTRPLGETTNVKGGAKDNLSDNNIGVVSDGTDTLTVKLAKTLTDLTSAEFGEKDSSDKTVINKDGVSSEVIGKDGNVISSTDLTSDGVTSESVIPETQTSSTETADDGTTTQTDTTTDGLDSNEVSSQGMTVSTSTTETKTTTVTPKDGTPETTVVETDTVKTTGVDNDGIRINTHETVTTTNPDGTTNVVENGGEVSLTSSGLNNGGNRAINVAAGVNATDAVNVSQLEAAKTHYYSVKTTTEQANFNNDTATGENSIAAGPNVWAQGSQSAVFGSMAGALGDKSTAMGNDAWALGTQSTAIGSGVEAHGQGSVAIGNADNNGKDKTIATNEAINSVAIGTHAVVTKADTVAIGHNAGAVNTQATALGANANAAGEQSNALGYKSSASGNQSTAVGTEANAAGKEATALGYKANSNGYRTTAIGHSSSATGSMAVALGNEANARGTLSQAFGDHAIASAENATAIGTNANANAEKGIAFGTHAGVSGVSGIAFGDGAMSNAKQAISIGKSARTTAENAVALGSSAIATSNNAIAVGNSSNAIGANSLAMGVNSKALKDNTIALGNNVSVTAANAVALGLNSTAYGENSIVMGISAKNTGNHAVAIGTGASAYRQNSIAMGKDSSTGGDFAVALGDSANAAAENTLALGKNAVADKTDSVALGNNAYTGDVIATESATLAGQVYEFAGKAPIGTVSVGNQGNERTITNVAAGRISSTSTDAINGSQLYAVSEVASRGWNIQANGDKASQVAPGATVQFIDGTNIDITRDGNNITIATAANVVTTETDKYVTGGKVAYDNQGNGTTTLTLKDGTEAQVTGAKNNFVTSATTDANGKKATLTRNDGGTVDIDLTNTVNQAVTEATDKGTKYAGDREDTGATANEFGRKLGETTKVLGGAQGELSDNNIGVVSNGVDTLTVKLAKALSGLTSAAFGSDATDQTVINKDGVTITNGADADKTVSLTETGLNNGGNKITNVKEGEAGTDAVNVNQLNQAITNNAYNWNISDGTNNTAVPDSGTVAVKGSANADSANTVGVVTELEGTNVKVDLSQKAKDDIANGQKHSSVAGDTNFVVTQTTTNPEGGKQYDVKLADKVVIGKDKPVTIDGTNGTVSGLTNTTWDPNTTYTGGQAATQEQLKSVSDVAQKGWNIQANSDTATKVAPGDTVKFIDGENIKITRTGNDITVATAKDVKFDSVKVGDKVSINNDGINAGDTKVTNVTNGTLAADSKDAVNGSQLYATNQNVTNNAANITKNADNIAKGTVYAGDRLDATVTGKTNNFTRALGEQTNVVGGATGELSDNNLAVISNGTDTLTVKLAKSLTDLTNATFGSTDTDKTVINKDGVTVSSDKPEKEVSLTDKGLNNGNNQITNVTSGLVKRDGNPVELSKAEGDVLTNAVNVGDLKTTVTNLTEEGKGGGFGLTAEDNKDVKADLGKTVKVQGDGSVKTTIVEKDGQSSLQVGLTENVTVGGQDKPGTITVKGENGKDGVSINGKDGSIGLTGAKGADGKDGANATITVANGPVGVDGTDGKDGKDGMTRIVYTDPKGTTHNVSTLNDGLNFAGNQGDTIAKKLNETLTVKGDLANDAAASSENLRVDSQDGALVVKLAQNLANLTTATFGNTDTDKTVVSKDGVTISSDKPEKEVSLTDKGLNNGNNQITNVTSGLTDSTGQKSDLANATTTNAVNVGDLKDTVNNLTNATTGGFGLKDDNNTEVKQDLGKTIQIKGKDGVTVTSDVANKSLEVALQGDVTVNGKDGKDGTIGVKGADGKDGTKITKDAVVFNGVDGKDGKDGQVSIKVEQGPKGIAGNDGKDGESKTRIVYEKPNGDKEQVATLNDGLNFVGDKGKVIAKKLNETLAIKGNLAEDAEVTDKNLRVDNENGQLIVKMAKSLTDLTNATFSSGDINATIGGNGLTITPKGGDVVSLTDKGLNNGNNTITNVAPGVNGTDAVNKDQLDGVNATANAGWNLTANGDSTNASNVAPNSTVDLANTDGNIVITKAGNNVTFDLNNNLTVGGPGKDGKPGKDGEFGVKGADGKTGVALNGKDGTIGINGKDGSNGSITVKQGKPGVDGKDGETKTRIVYETKDETGKPTTEEVATLNDGLKFVGDTGEVIAKKLNETLAIKGNLTATAAVTDKNLRVDNENGQLIVKMAKSLTDLTNATFGSDNSNTTIGGNGVTITPNGGDAGNTVSLTDKGLNNGNNQVTNVSTGLKDRNGNNVTLANASGDVLNNAVNVGDLKDSVHNLTNATTGGFGLTDEKGNDVKADLGKTVTVQGDGSVKTEVVEKDGKKALQIGLTNNVTVGNDKEPGTITVKGENGKDGVSISGKDGIGIKGENGQDAVSINGKDGDGTVAVKGKEGKTGVALNGKDGTIGINGKDGSNGSITVAQGAKGLDGNDGANGTTKTRIVYEKPNGDKEEVATLNDGLNFVGDKGKVIAKKLNETLAIKGNLAENAEVTDKNLRVDNVNGDLIIKMAKSLRDLTDATFTNVGGDKSVVTGNGLTITPANGGNTVSLTTSGLDNGGNKVINVAAGDVNANSTDAVNGSQLYAVSEVANKGWNIQTNGNDTTNVKPGDTVNFVNGNNIAITNDGTKVTVGLVKNVDLGEDGSIKAGDTLVNNDGVKVGDNVSLTKDGLTAGDVKISATTGINAGNKQITNVASGLGGKKLSEAEGDTLTNAANISDLQTAVSSVTDASQGGGFGLTDDNGQEVKQDLGKTIAVKGDGKNISTVVNGDALTVNLNKDVDLGNDGSLTAGGTKVSEQGVSFADSLVNLTSNGLDNGGNKVTNVKAGDVNANSTDAVNGSQLYATNQNVTNVQNEVAKGWNIEAGTVDGGKVFNASKTKVAMGDTVGVKAGKNIEITQDGANIAIATSANPTFETVTTESVKVGKGDNTVAIETVTDKHGSALKVSGADGKSETRINNVADGKADNDAVNVRQLRGVAQNVANIDNRVSKLDKRVRGIGANSAAASSLPQVYIPGKSMVALAGGAYSGASAVAVGYSRASDNGKVILKVNGTANSAGHYSGGVGVGYQW
ncbi:YadA-like family protein [Actinobacillus genomosp. 1]|uniref:YadA-like family protein n=1 Tax=Actinobacillus genomosp. 1 TaxID=254839 RepID=UPI0024422C54|nr:YadA-like family protein [Actinobacillus genomosp. 1]WGE34083.1 YadA-like family protein [Actinobacillus genomosp. 1]